VERLCSLEEGGVLNVSAPSKEVRMIRASIPRPTTPDQPPVPLPPPEPGPPMPAPPQARPDSPASRAG